MEANSIREVIRRNQSARKKFEQGFKGGDIDRPVVRATLKNRPGKYRKLRISPGAGLTDEQQEKWVKLLNDRGRFPYIMYPLLCAKCGTLWPEMFSVPDVEWKHYVEPRMRDEMLCEACYTQIKAWIDGEGLGRRTIRESGAQ
jgi:hypothetical protein